MAARSNVLAARYLSLACGVALFPQLALAQDGFDAHGFDQTYWDGDLHDLMQTWRPEEQKGGAVGIQLLGEYAESPLVLVQGEGATEEELTLLDNLIAVSAGVHIGLHERIGVAVGIPMWLSSRGPTETEGLGLGDLSLAVPIGIVLQDEGKGFGLSVIPQGTLPTGSPSRFLGADQLTGGLLLAPGIGFGRLNLTGNVGLELGRTNTFQNIDATPRMVTALGATVGITEHMSLGLEGDLRSVLKKNEVGGTASPGEAVMHLKGRYPFGMHWALGGAYGFTRGQSAAQFRLFFGLGWTFGKDGPRDYDADGFIGAADQCDREPETVNGWKDDDGCPDMLSTYALVVRDPEGVLLSGAAVTVDGRDVGTTDAQGRLIVRDLMPETSPVFVAEHGSGLYIPGTLEAEPLVEGEQAGEMQLQWRPGTVRVIARSNGAPVDAKVSFDGPETWEDLLLGADGTETFVLPPGEWSVFATAPQYGTERRDIVLAAAENALTVIEFALEPATTVVTESGVIILEPVQFEFDSARLLPASTRLLEHVANDIRTTPEVRVIEVQGHTSTEGTTSYNRDLSQRRVESVVDYLVGHGVDRSRLVPIGYGESCTAVRETSEADRAKNRRVQFFILEPAPAAGIPCHMGVPGQLDEERFEFERQREVQGE